METVKKNKFLYLLTKNEEVTENYIDNLNLIFQNFSDYIYALQIRIKDSVIIEKSIKKFKEICFRYSIPLIINDFLDIAKKYDVDGIHIGHDDISINECLQFSNKIIGVSCYNNIEKAKLAADKGASYISFGCFYNSTTKPNPVAFADKLLLKKWKNINKKIITVAIGGINHENFIQLMQSGADVIAISSYIWNSDSQYKQIEKIIRNYKNFTTEEKGFEPLSRNS